MNIKEIVLGLCDYTDEQEWFELKENWFQLLLLTSTVIKQLSQNDTKLLTNVS